MTREDNETDPGLVWWLIDLARRDRETYRKLRELGWLLAQRNPESSVNPNEVS